MAKSEQRTAVHSSAAEGERRSAVQSSGQQRRRHWKLVEIAIIIFKAKKVILLAFLNDRN